MTEDQNNHLQQNNLEQEIEFEDIEAWTGDRGDTGLTARMKLKRNFDKIKAWIASVDFSLNLKDWFLSKTDDDEAQGEIGFRKGIWIGIKKWFIDLSGNANLNTMRLNGDANISGTVYTNSIKTDDYTGDGMFDSGGMFQYLHGKAKLVCDMIVCRGKFIVNEIEDRIWTYAGGNMIFSAAGSTIFFVEYLDADENPLGYSYINSPWLLKKTPLLGGLIAWSKRKQIQRRLTEYEKSCVRKFRCYEVSDDGTMQTRNWWHENDLAFCQTLNRVKQKTRSTSGYTGSLSNTVYWRKVTGTGSKEIPILDDGKVYDYVDLSLTDCDPVYNDWPAAGDVIVQRGNDTDPDRQGFTTIEVTGDKRGVKVYDDVSGYSMAQKLKTFLGYDANLKRALLEVFGDAYIGAPGEHGDIHNGATYVRYNSKTGKLEIKANISAESVFDENSEEAKTLATVISGLDTGIGEAKDAAAGAKKAADDAQTDATANKTRLNNWASDGYISPTEKTGLKIQWEDMKKEYENICNDAEKYGVNRNAYTTAYFAANSAFSKYTSTAAENITVDADFANIAAYYAARQTILDAIAAAAKKYAEDQAKAVSEAHEYLRNALSGKTETLGGLLLTTFINLRQFNGGDKSDPANYTTWGGLNGVYENGNTPAAWFGGPMVDRRNNDGSYDIVSSSKANSMIRMDGSGYFARGKFFWGNDGSATFKGRVESSSMYLYGEETNATLNLEEVNTSKSGFVKFFGYALRNLFGQSDYDAGYFGLRTRLDGTTQAELRVDDTDLTPDGQSGYNKYTGIFNPAFASFCSTIRGFGTPGLKLGVDEQNYPYIESNWDSNNPGGLPDAFWVSQHADMPDGALYVDGNTLKVKGGSNSGSGDSSSGSTTGNSGSTMVYDEFYLPFNDEIGHIYYICPDSTKTGITVHAFSGGAIYTNDWAHAPKTEYRFTGPGFVLRSSQFGFQAFKGY